MPAVCQLQSCVCWIVSTIPYQLERYAIVMAGFDAGCNAGTRAQVVDQPEARGNDQNDDDGGGQVLPHAATILLVLAMLEWIGNRPRGASGGRLPPLELENSSPTRGVSAACRSLVIGPHAICSNLCQP